MNKDRRKAIASLQSRLETLLEEAQTIAGEEADYFEAMPSGIQFSERGEQAENASNLLQDACDNLQLVLDALEEASV